MSEETWAAPAGLMPGAPAVGLLVWAPWTSPPPVPQPTGLTVGASTTSSVVFTWSGPISGPVPDQYVIWQDSVAIASVSGNVVSYKARGLAPDTAYHYQVQTVRGIRRSPRSAVLTASTLAPPISAARLTGTWTTQFPGNRGRAERRTSRLPGLQATGCQVTSPTCG